MGEIEVQQITPPAPIGTEEIKPPTPTWPTKTQPPQPPGPHKPQPYNPNLDRGRLALIWIFQLAVGLGLAAICWKFGVSAWMWVPGFVLFLSICGALGWRMWRNASISDPLPEGDILVLLMKAGIWSTSLGMLALAWAMYLRIDTKESKLGLGFCLVLVLLAILTLLISKYAYKHQSTPWFQFTVGVTCIPFLLAWLVSSGLSWFLNPRLPGHSGFAKLDQARADELAKREKWAQHAGWKTAENRTMVTAVTLSGGGYRAAAIHAGLLQALDEKCVPINYLSTVSGGSIIGAWYALGYPPRAFKEKLIARRPGLADDALSIQWVFLDWLWPSWSSADTYSWHFRNVFFGPKTLSDTGSHPRLLVNATDIEQNADHAREVYYKGRDSAYPELDRTLLADIVAASGAFPGAFQPEVVAWPPANGPGKPRNRRFTDGGVVENLGVEGLGRFLKLKTDNKLPDSPDLIILSDASKRSLSGELPVKVELLQLMSRSQGISYDSLHAEIYKHLDGERFVPIRATHEEATIALASYTFQSALSKKRQPVSGKQVAAEVATYDTLKELAPEQMEKAFWVGHTLGTTYWNKINAVRQKLGGSGAECPAT